MKKILSLTGALIFICLFAYSGKTHAQVSNNQVPWTDTTHVEYNRWYIGGMFGAYQFYGDISEKTYFPGSGMKGKFNWMFGLKAGRDFNSRFGARINYSMGQMYSQKGSSWFKANVRDLQLDFTMNMSNIVAPYRYNKKWNTTIYVGAGFFGYRSLLRDQSNSDQIIGYVGYDKNGNKTQMIYKTCIDLGVNVAYRISNHLDVFTEIGLTNTPVDNLDAKAVVLSELDNYSHVSIGIHYTFGKYSDAYKWNPKPDYLKAIENKMVDMGNNVDSVEACCARKSMINPCDTSTADDDGDKVPNCRDLELDSPEGSIVNFQGIAIISPDSATGEPMVVAAVAPPKNTAPAIFFSPIYFKYDQATVDSIGDYTLTNLAVYMKLNPNARILISGNCDKHASEEYNMGLSLRRCKRAKEILTKEYSISPDRFELEPNGKKYLLFPKNDHANRRVDFSLIQ